MANSGALTMGVKLVPPMPPREEIENVAPDISAGDFAVAHFLGDGAEVLAELQDALAVDVLDDGNDQAVRRVDGNADVVIFLVDQRVFLGLRDALKSGMLLQRRRRKPSSGRPAW